MSNNKIKEVTLKHCLNALKYNIPGDLVKQTVDLVNKVHDNRMKEKDINEVEVLMEDFEEVLEKLKRNHKRSYDFITKSGDGFKSSMFKLGRRLIQKEEVPSRFFQTKLHQLWKKKHTKENLSNHCFIHMKDWLPKLDSGTKYQIGGKPCNRVEEHLITAKALIARSIVSGGGCMIQVVDIKGFFDAESLRGVMGSLYKAEIRG